jgi:hypothetical protein
MTTLDRVTKVVADVLRVPEDRLTPSMRIEDIAETDFLTLAEIVTAPDAEQRGDDMFLLADRADTLPEPRGTEKR